ncbi:uncharacterized protein LOC129716974 [Wyeomyia smithii]|uniref:uncharacterized protein LOC129716974 n=1 Tax=Wyeomyia smithii TaxID=174621 RepID=UPI0024681D6F|nr:uncharacterized protein LOC129716974 [Wyeomyia smithii]
MEKDYNSISSEEQGTYEVEFLDSHYSCSESSGETEMHIQSTISNSPTLISASNRDDEKRSTKKLPTAGDEYSSLDDLEPAGNSSEEKLFSFHADILEKKFKGQKSFEKRGTVEVTDDSVEGVLNRIWEYCAQFITKAVIFKDFDPKGHSTNLEAAWDNEDPSFESKDKFLIFQDKSGKRNIAPSDVTSNTLQGWLSKTITVVVYRYSDSVLTAHKYHAVESQLLRPAEKDRAGAESNVSLHKLKETLKVSHGNHLTSDDINWSCWANYISTQPTTMREELINQLPPKHLIALFRTVPIHSDTVLLRTKFDLRVAENENKAYTRIVGQLKQDCDNLRTLVAVMGRRILEMEQLLHDHCDMITAMRNTVTVEDNEYSQFLASKVTDCTDVDHE